VYIVVNSITDQKTPQSGQGKNLARLARECFAKHQPLTLDFEGVATITQGFFQEVFLPLVAEFGAEFLNNHLQFVNVSPAIDEIIKSAFSHLDAYFDQRGTRHNRDCDLDMYELNLTWLIKARELARENSIFAELMMGISDDDMRSAISQLSIEDMQHIAQSGWLCFSPRFSSHFIQSVTARQHDGVDVLLGLSGSLK
jgi:hypothetical protein